MPIKLSPNKKPWRPSIGVYRIGRATIIAQATLTVSLRGCWFSLKQAALAMDNMLDRDLAKVSSQSIQARLIRTIFQSMDQMLDTLRTNHPDVPSDELFDLIASSLSQSSIGVGVLSPDVDPDLYFRNINGRAKALTQTDHIRPVLISAAGGSETTAGTLVGVATHEAEALASRLVGTMKKSRVLGAAYATALDATTGTYRAGGATQSGEGAPLDALRSALNEATQAATLSPRRKSGSKASNAVKEDTDREAVAGRALASRVATRLVSAVEATALLSEAKAHDEIDTSIATIQDPELITLMRAHAETGLRALTSVLATMALTHAYRVLAVHQAARTPYLSAGTAI